jgi:CRISPR-associated endonuclease/helicase Cas3
MACLPKVKHFFLRILGVYRKVLILDEVHSYDAYTSELLRALVFKGHIVILLSATLTAGAKRRLLGLPDASLVSGQAYPMVTALRNGCLSTHSPVIPLKDIIYRVQLGAPDKMLLDALQKARAGYKVIWFENIVDEAQELYNRIPDDIPKGLLHSRYTKEHREKKESYWISRYGKNSTSTEGSFLVTTQVAEQSLDIDADVMYTALCPTDMLLQRLGRVWRHERPRPKGLTMPEVYVHAGQFSSSAKNIHEFSKAYGGKTPYVYEPYVLLKTADLLATTDTIAIPSQIRQVLEDTYRDDGKHFFWKRVMERTDKANTSTAGQALSKGLLGIVPDAEEEHRLGTRLIQGDVAEVLMVDELLQKDQVIIDGRIYDLADFKAAGVLDTRKIKVRQEKIATCLHELTPKRFPVLVMVCRKGIILNKDGTSSGARYSEERGLTYDEGGRR